jgi:transcriptional regulator with PAS, ATPase and Fis domain
MSQQSSEGRERRRYPRAELPLPLQLYDLRSEQRLAVGSTVNVSPVGMLAQFGENGQFEPGQLARVHVGLPAEVWPEQSGLFTGRVLRVESGPPALCALAVEEEPPAFLHAPELVGLHPSMLEVKSQLLEVVDYDVNILVQGESGTGKNVAAALIHRYSRRSKYPFIRVNCPSIPDTLLESQLFGHERGAFTDAKQAQPGLFRVADRGTLVLDEISAVPSAIQAKLLQAIEEKKFVPVGGRRTVEVDVRLIATTNDSMEKRIREGDLRKDLFYRLNEVTLTMPPLRDRKSDVPLLADYFMRRYCSEFRKPYRPLSRGTLEMFRHYAWPGNVRELENTIKRGVLIGQFEAGTSTPRRPAAGPEDGSSYAPDDALSQCRSMREARDEAEKRALVEALEAADYDRTKAAAQLGISYRTLLRRIRKYDVRV